MLGGTLPLVIEAAGWDLLLILLPGKKGHCPGNGIGAAGPDFCTLYQCQGRGRDLAALRIALLVHPCTQTHGGDLSPTLPRPRLRWRAPRTGAPGR